MQEDRSSEKLTESLISHQQSHYRQEKTKIEQQEKYTKVGVINGESILQSLFFTWVYRYLKRGSKKTATIQEMPILPKHLRAQYEFNKLHNNYQSTTKSKRQGFTLIKAMFKTYLRDFLIVIAISFLYVGLSMYSPFLASQVMDYISYKNQYQATYGYLLFGLTIVSSFIRFMSECQMNFKFGQMGLNLTNSITLLIYNKSLKYPSSSEKIFSESEIINYSQVDAQRMTYMGWQLVAIIMCPLQIIIGIIMMYNFVGISFLSGIGAIILSIGLTFLVSKKSIVYNDDVLKVKDQRMKYTQQLLDIIKYIKINTIEKFFYNKVDKSRMEQIKLYKKKGMMDILNIFIFWTSCPLILSATFFTYIQIGNQMNSTVAFTTIMIFTILQYPIRLLPNCISEVIQIYSSIKRVQKFLQAKEIQYDHIKNNYDPSNQIAVKIENGDFYWGIQIKKDKKDEKDEKNDNKKDKKDKKPQKDKIIKDQIQKQKQLQQSEGSLSQSQSDIEKSAVYTEEDIKQDRNPVLNQNKIDNQSQKQKQTYIKALKDINTNIYKNKFTIVIGDIGCGKSSLILAIINQMTPGKKTNIQINGSIAYASQKPWIMSSTIKQNIIFTLPFDEQKFKKVLYFSSLEQDLKIMPNGVQTQIGQKGINLSGGQKARVSLARALYSQKDIYLLDDILSAVDVHVGQFLMKQTLLGYLKGKTILMPTHAIKFAQFVDQIIIMKKGRIIRKGHYTDISNTEQFSQVSTKFNKIQQKKEESQQQKIQMQLKMLKEVISKKTEDKNISDKIEDKLIQQMILPQDHSVGNIDYKYFKQYIYLNGGMFRFAFLTFMAMFMWMIFLTSASIIMERWCEDPIGQGVDLYIYIGLSIGSNIFIFFRAYNLVISGARQGEKVHKQMIKSLLYASLGNFYNRVPVGRIINRLTKDLRELDEAIGYAVGSLLVCIFCLLQTLILCIYSSSPYIIIPIIIVLFLTQKIRSFYMKTQREVSRHQKITNSPIVTGFLSTINGLPSIRAYHKQQQFTADQIDKIDNNKKVRLNKQALQIWFNLALTYVSFSITMGAIAFCIISDNQNPSLAGLLMTYALTLSSDIIYVTSSFSYFQTKIISLQRIYSFMKLQPQPAYRDYCSNWSEKQEGSKNSIEQGQIQFKNTNARYRIDLPIVIKDLNLKIKSGEKIGIVGRTGAGKTTIINTLLMITEISSGDILFDGKSIKQIPIKDLRNSMTMIDQEPIILKSTFRQNLDITGKYSDQQLYGILKECKLYETVIEKGGLDSNISNQSLSAGERQLLCICRAFLKHSKIVLIDEATANIDIKHDNIIQEVIQQKFKQCTVLTIAHRLSTLQNSDKIVVMEKGKLIEFGSPSELQKNTDGFYYKMVLKNESQFLV